MDPADRHVNGGEHRRSQLAGQVAGHLIHLHGLAADQNDFPGKHSECLRNRQGVRWNCDMHVNPLYGLDRVHFENVDGSRHSPTGHRVRDNQQVARRQQLLGEADPRRADFHQLDARAIQPGSTETADYFDAKAVVAAERIAKTGYERATHSTTLAGTRLASQRFPWDWFDADRDLDRPILDPHRVHPNAIAAR